LFSTLEVTTYFTDARHFLDEKGAIGPQRDPARAMAEFHAAAIAFATDFDDTGVAVPMCFKCYQAQCGDPGRSWKDDLPTDVENWLAFVAASAVQPMARVKRGARPSIFH
jgi:hypothetical protein